MELGLTTGKRAIKNGAKYDKYFSNEESAYGNYRMLDNHGTVQDTVKHIAKLIVSKKKRYNSHFPDTQRRIEKRNRSERSPNHG